MEVVWQRRSWQSFTPHELRDSHSSLGLMSVTIVSGWDAKYCSNLDRWLEVYQTLANVQEGSIVATKEKGLGQERTRAVHE